MNLLSHLLLMTIGIGMYIVTWITHGLDGWDSTTCLLLLLILSAIVEKKR